MHFCQLYLSTQLVYYSVPLIAQCNYNFPDSIYFSAVAEEDAPVRGGWLSDRLETVKVGDLGVQPPDVAVPF